MSVLVNRLKTWVRNTSVLRSTLALGLVALVVANAVGFGVDALVYAGRPPALAILDLAVAVSLTVALILLPLLALCVTLTKRLDGREARLALETALHRRAEQRFQDFAECSSDWLWETDEEHRFVYFSERHEEVLGIPGRARIGKKRTELRHGSDIPSDWEAHLDDLANRRPFRNFRYATYNDAGERRIMQVSGKPVFDAEGRFRGYRGVGHDITREYDQETALREREQRLSMALRAARVGDWRMDLTSGVLTWSDEIYRIWGVSPETFEPAPEIVMGWLEPEERARVDGLVAGATERREAVEYEFCGRRPDGEIRHVWIEVVPEEDASGAVVALFGVCRDITEEKRVESALRASQERFRHFAEAASDWLWETDAAQRFTYLSDRIHMVAGCEPAWFLGKRRDQVVPDCSDETWQAHLRDLAARRPFREFMYRFVRPDGAERWFKIGGLPVFDEHGAFAGYRGTGSDITEKVQAEQQVRRLAHHDPLTGLPNRTLFQDRLEQAIAMARRTGRKVALLQLDLDRFKEVNDSLGHAAGDALLCASAARLETCVRGSDTVARLGGDEFAIILAGLQSASGASRVARKAVEALAKPFEFQGQTIHSGTSIGATIYPLDGTDCDVLLRNADMALYQAKESGRNAHRFFVPAMQEQIERRRRTEAEIRSGLADDVFTLHFQPVVRLADHAVCGFEALLRWRHPERGLITPGEFIAIAEEAGLTVPLGEIVLWRACAQARAWLDAGLDPGRIAVNLSTAQFLRGDLPRSVREALRDSGLPAHYLEFEITETVLMDRHKAEVFAVLGDLHRQGISFALDDFGTGYASLSHLKQFHVDRLKIDQSFVRDIGIDPDDAAIARAVINLGHSLDMQVVAEGVESEEQLGFLRVNGCDFAQGFRFSAALSADEATTYLREARRRQREPLPLAGTELRVPDLPLA